MSRGRHRHSSVLGRVVPPTAAGVLLVAALAALLFSQDTILVRSVGVAAVFATLGFAVLLKQRDKAARAAAEMFAAQRMRADERFEEQLAEAEYAAEVAEERATRFGRRLTAEKSRLAKAETEIARLLRERAVMVAEQALKEAEAAQRALAASRPKYPASPAAFVRAGAVLRLLARRAAEQEAQRERTAGAEVALRARTVPVAQAPVAPSVPAPVAPAVPTPAQAPAVQAPAQAPAPTPVKAAPVRPMLTATVGQLGGASSVPAVPAERQRPRPAQSGQARGQGFSFFGRSPGAAVRAAAPAPAVGSVAELNERTDLADVVGDEAVAAKALADAQAAEASAKEPRPAVEPEQGEPTVVDLTPEDETEQIQLPRLRASR
ncbi:hypothetical protein F7Q99_11300 [Streptomyces kaniharaensis]|uniref:Secreted protein n=1 Tax=Streptomyces kaniharaensis TaxID=212423 RepID=A0A6N7KS96_9ACTN|nr:hypothetical protein [Streptomyces kaniharaensis]MQS12864.1 hypothetical protein [Streptomyces kaniharaensis]